MQLTPLQRQALKLFRPSRGTIDVMKSLGIGDRAARDLLTQLHNNHLLECRPGAGCRITHAGLRTLKEVVHASD